MTDGHQVALRGHRRWRRRLRHLPDQAAGRSRRGCPGAGCRARSRRNLVLEPLSGRALRFRELHLRLFVLEGAAQRVALEGALFGAAGEPALPQLRRRQVRSAQIHAVQPQGRGGDVRRGQQSVAAQARRRPRADLPLRHSRGRAAVDADAAAAGRHGDVQGPLVPHLLLAARAGRTGRQEGRHHRHRRHRDPGDRRDRRQGRRTHRVPAPPELERAAQQRPDLRRRRWPTSARATTRSLPPAPARPAASSTSRTGAASTRSRARSGSRCGTSSTTSPASASG